MSLLTIPLLTFFGALLLHAAALKVFPKLNLLDFPERYNLKRKRLPYPTGILAVVGFLAVSPLLFEPTLHDFGILISVFVLGLISFIDDRTPLPFWLRLAIQVAAAVTLFATGSRIYTITNPLGGIISLDSVDILVPGLGPLPLWSGVFTIVWILLTVNALNWFDGIPGQVTSLSTIGFILLGLLALLRNGQPDVAMISFTLAALALGAFFFDFPPAKVVLGDSGSMFFGLMLGLLGIGFGGKVATAFLAFGIPVVDALFVIIRRLAHGKSPFQGGGDHLHHRLLKKGWSERQVVLLTITIGTVFGTSALFLDTAGKAVAGIILVIIVGALTFYTKEN